MLCLHGFAGTPAEFGPLVDALERERFEAEAPLLAGHGAGASALGAATREDWLATAHGSLAALASRTAAPVAVVGASMGALLAVDLACSHPDLVGALVLIAPPVGPGPGARARRGLQRWARRLWPGGRLRQAAPGPGRADVADPAAAVAIGPPTPAPLSAVIEYERLLGESELLYGDVRQPVLVVHGRLDRTVRRKDAEAAAARLAAGATVETLWLDQSAHLVAIDRQRAALAARVCVFLREALAPSIPGVTP